MEDRTITARGASETKNNYIWLPTDQEYQDFELRLKVQTYSKSTGNSGLQIHPGKEILIRFKDLKIRPRLEQ